MNNQLMTLYVLFWPLLAASVLFVICKAVYKDVQEAKETGEELL